MEEPKEFKRAKIDPKDHAAVDNAAKWTKRVLGVIGTDALVVGAVFKDALWAAVKKKQSQRKCGQAAFESGVLFGHITPKGVLLGHETQKWEFTAYRCEFPFLLSNSSNFGFPKTQKSF